jgi:hypothetical protein
MSRSDAEVAARATFVAPAAGDRRGEHGIVHPGRP